MRPAAIRISASIIVGMAIVLAACQPAAVGSSVTESGAPGSPLASVSPTETTSPIPSPSPTSSASETANASPTTAAASPPQFACEPLDIQRDADRTHALIADVRVGTHPAYDRVVFEFGPGGGGAPSGVPEYVLKAVQPPLTQDPSGQSMEVPGKHYVEVALLGGTKYDENYNLIYGGPTQFDPGFPMLVALYERGDFEATSTWYLGLDQEPCLRAFTLTDPMRLVVDIAH